MGFWEWGLRCGYTCWEVRPETTKQTEVGHAATDAGDYEAAPGSVGVGSAAFRQVLLKNPVEFSACSEAQHHTLQPAKPEL